ncbi:unnamed protein product [Darwinula stevensoni]|uniref:Uncharacterized protein n=1 Tax=Darwinula stevensoni TaxID=69355 RepID=A0A7R8XDB3_9CRUS|nr:unnamed protein product [Darwinula stevensoni]CAG0888463.1 unnamed protein product [Darwinula stevensoni]
MRLRSFVIYRVFRVNYQVSGGETARPVSKVRVTFYEFQRPLPVNNHQGQGEGMPGEEMTPTQTQNTSAIHDTTPLSHPQSYSLTRQLSSDSGKDNPFRPDGELSREADEIVELIKEGKPLTPTKKEESICDVPDAGKKVVDEKIEGAQVSKVAAAAPSPTRSPGANGSAAQGPVEVQHTVVTGPNEASQVERVVLKKKSKKGCCACDGEDIGVIDGGQSVCEWVANCFNDFSGVFCIELRRCRAVTEESTLHGAHEHGITVNELETLVILTPEHPAAVCDINAGRKYVSPVAFEISRASYEPRMLLDFSVGMQMAGAGFRVLKYEYLEFIGGQKYMACLKHDLPLIHEVRGTLNACCWPCVAKDGTGSDDTILCRKCIVWRCPHQSSLVQCVAGLCYSHGKEVSMSGMGHVSWTTSYTLGLVAVFEPEFLGKEVSGVPLVTTGVGVIKPVVPKENGVGGKAPPKYCLHPAGEVGFGMPQILGGPWDIMVHHHLEPHLQHKILGARWLFFPMVY